MTETPAQRRAAYARARKIEQDAIRKEREAAYDAVDAVDEPRFADLNPGDRIVAKEWPTNPFTVHKTKHVKKPYSCSWPEAPLHQRGVDDQCKVYGEFDRPEESLPWPGGKPRTQLLLFPEETVKRLAEKR